MLFNHLRSHMLRTRPRIENFQSDLEEANSLPSSLKTWLESTISISRTTSQDSHLCSNPTTSVTDGASERSSEKSYKIVTHDDFFIADETAGKFSESSPKGREWSALKVDGHAEVDGLFKSGRS